MANKLLTRYGTALMVFDAPVIAGGHIYQGDIVVRDSSGWARTRAIGALASTDLFLGIAEAEVDNTLGANGALTVALSYGQRITLKNSAIDALDAADITAYVEDADYACDYRPASVNIPMGTVVSRTASACVILVGLPSPKALEATVATLDVTGTATAGNLDVAAPGTMLIGDVTATKVEIGKTGVEVEAQGPLDAVEGILASDLDARSAATLTLGKSTATKVEIADTLVVTEIQGPLVCTEGLSTMYASADGGAGAVPTGAALAAAFGAPGAGTNGQLRVFNNTNGGGGSRHVVIGANSLWYASACTVV